MATVNDDNDCPERVLVVDASPHAKLWRDEHQQTWTVQLSPYCPEIVYQEIADHMPADAVLIDDGVDDDGEDFLIFA